MLARLLRPWLVWLGLVSSSCALAGYDFGEYERSDGDPAASRDAGAAAAAGALATDLVDPPLVASCGEAGSPDLTPVTTLGVGAGGASGGERGRVAVDASVGHAGSGGEAGAGATSNPRLGGAGDGPVPAGVCDPLSCFELLAECGPADDGCGAPLDCGRCFWWFQDCRQNRCENTY